MFLNQVTPSQKNPCFDVNFLWLKILSIPANEQLGRHKAVGVERLKIESPGGCGQKQKQEAHHGSV